VIRWHHAVFLPKEYPHVMRGGGQPAVSERLAMGRLNVCDRTGIKSTGKNKLGKTREGKAHWELPPQKRANFKGGETGSRRGVWGPYAHGGIERQQLQGKREKLKGHGADAKIRKVQVLRRGEWEKKGGKQSAGRGNAETIGGGMKKKEVYRTKNA